MCQNQSGQKVYGSNHKAFFCCVRFLEIQPINYDPNKTHPNVSHVYLENMKTVPKHE